MTLVRAHIPADNHKTNLNMVISGVGRRSTYVRDICISVITCRIW